MSEFVASGGPGIHPQPVDLGPVEAPAPVAGVNGQRVSLSQGAETARSPVTIIDQDRHEWRWMCSWCGTGEGGYSQAHHALVVGDEHTLSHHHPELHGGPTLWDLQALRHPTRCDPTPHRKDRAMPRRSRSDRGPVIPDLSHVDTDWMGRGACVDVDPDVFFPEHWSHHRFTQAQAICGACPVQVECLEYALEVPVEHGIWGGKSERERRRMRRERKAS